MTTPAGPEWDAEVDALADRFESAAAPAPQPAEKEDHHEDR